MKAFPSFVAVCILLGCQTEASPLRPESAELPRRASTETTDSVLAMLKEVSSSLDGDDLKWNLNILSKMVETFRVCIQLSPLLNSVLHHASSLDTVLETIDKIIRGKVPDTTDLIQLQQYQHQTTATHLTEGLANSHGVQKFHELKAQPDTRSSHHKLARIVEALSDRDVTFQHHVVKAMANGNSTTTLDNFAETGLLHIICFVIDNWDNVVDATLFHKSTNDSVGVLQNLARIDLDDLMKVMVMRTEMESDTYLIKGHHLVTDPDAVHVREAVADADSFSHSPQDQQIAAARVVDTFHHFCSLSLRAVDRLVQVQASQNKLLG